MLQDVFEEGELTLVGEVDGNALVGTFHLFIDGNEVGTKSGNVDEQGRVLVPYRLPMVPDELDSYLFSYSFEAGESTQPGGDEYCVWHSQVNIQALDINNGEAPFRRFKVSITQGGTVEVVTLVGPEHSWPCQEPGPVTIEAVAPGEIKEWRVNEGRSRVFLGEKKYEVAIVAPESNSDDGVEQLVYSTSTSTDFGQKGEGHTIKLVLQPKDDVGKEESQRLGLEGDPIYIEAKFTLNTKRDNPKPGITGLEPPTTGEALKDEGTISKHGDTRTRIVRGIARLGRNGAPAMPVLELGRAGKDEVTIKVGSTDQVADATLKITNHRKLVATISKPSQLSLPDLSATITAFEKVGIDLSVVNVRDFDESDADMPTSHAGWLPGEWFGVGPGKVFSVIKPSRFDVALRDVYNREHRAKKNHIYMAVVDHILKVQAREDVKSFDDEFEVLPGVLQTKFPADGADTVDGVLIQLSMSRPDKFLPKSMIDGGSPVKDVEWEVVGGEPEHLGKSGNISDSDVSVSESSLGSISLRFPIDLLTLISEAQLDNTPLRIQIRFDYHKVRTHVAGYAKASRERMIVSKAQRNPANFKTVVVHELGHVCDGVLSSPPNGYTKADHGHHYVRRGHVGNHCAFGVADYADATKKLNTTKSARESKCVMFGRVNGKLDFCEHCAPTLMAQSLSKLGK